MSTCPRCDTQQERPCTYAERTKEFYDAMIPALRFVARSCGYALAIHGSLKTDIDLIAAPWREHCVGPDYLAERIRITAETIIGTARVRPSDTITS